MREADGSLKSMAALKNMTSQLIGRFCQSAWRPPAPVRPENLTRYNAELMVPDETVMEIAVMKGLATTFVMTTEHRQPIYERQREVLHALVTALSATGTATWNRCSRRTGATRPTTARGFGWSSTRWRR